MFLIYLFSICSKDEINVCFKFQVNKLAIVKMNNENNYESLSTCLFLFILFTNTFLLYMFVVMRKNYIVTNCIYMLILTIVFIRGVPFHCSAVIGFASVVHSNYQKKKKQSNRVSFR